MYERISAIGFGAVRSRSRQRAKARAHRAACLTATTRLGSDWLIPRNNAVTPAETPPVSPWLASLRPLAEQIFLRQICRRHRRLHPWVRLSHQIFASDQMLCSPLGERVSINIIVASVGGDLISSVLYFRAPLGAMEWGEELPMVGHLEIHSDSSDTVPFPIPLNVRYRTVFQDGRVT